MTSFESLLAGAETDRAIIPGNPEHSLLVEQIPPDDKGEAEMPKKDTPLAKEEIALIRKWITEGAVDDTPENARQHYDAEHLPTYSRPPVITALDDSPDGTKLAASGQDGLIRIIDVETGTIAHSFIPVETATPDSVVAAPQNKKQTLTSHRTANPSPRSTPRHFARAVRSPHFPSSPPPSPSTPPTPTGNSWSPQTSTMATPPTSPASSPGLNPLRSTASPAVASPGPSPAAPST
jgi:hypothetical protein